MGRHSGQLRVPVPVQMVWDVATDLEHSGWRTDLKSMTRAGENSFVETNRDGVPVKLTVMASEPCRRMAMQVEGKNSYGIRELLFEGDDEGTTFTIREEVMGRTAFAHLSEGLYLKEYHKTYLRDLNNELHRRVYGE